MNVRLLMLEDSAGDATLVLDALRDYGLEPECERVETGHELQRLLAEQQWDAVLCDYEMPGVTAEDAVRIVRSHDRNLPFILVSGTVDASVAVRMMRQGMHDYVMKNELMRLGPAIEREIRQARHRRSEEIEELNRIESLGKLAGNMAHEFNNVLMGIQPFNEVIRRSVAENEKVRQATDFIADAVQRGRRVTQEILRFARPTSPERTEVEIGALLSRVEQTGRSIVKGTHQLIVEAVAGNATIGADSEQLMQVFSNLLINASDAMDPGGTIRITAKIDERGAKYQLGAVDNPEMYVHFEVRDTGCGMPPEVSQKIFEPMFTTKRTGTGLGLAIAHQIITAHKGYVFVESRPGEGTSFHLFLPLREGSTSALTGGITRLAGEAE